MLVHCAVVGGGVDAKLAEMLIIIVSELSKETLNSAELSREQLIAIDATLGQIGNQERCAKFSEFEDSGIRLEAEVRREHEPWQGLACILIQYVSGELIEDLDQTISEQDSQMQVVKHLKILDIKIHILALVDGVTGWLVLGRVPVTLDPLKSLEGQPYNFSLVGAVDDLRVDVTNLDIRHSQLMILDSCILH
jgi:hypothetical protein